MFHPPFQCRSSVEMVKAVDWILVPQGLEYRHVLKGLGKDTANHPKILQIPIGSQPVVRHLKQWQQTKDFLNKPAKRVLLMGLCGSLSPQYRVGDIVLYQKCGYVPTEIPIPSLQIGLDRETCPLKWRDCDRPLTDLVDRYLPQSIFRVNGLTSDRLIWAAPEKADLRRGFGTDVVDMEGFAVLEVLDRAGIAAAMVRVISDEVWQTLPDLTSAISGDGSLKPLPIARQMVKQPIAAINLIRGSLKSLKVLQQLTHYLFERKMTTSEIDSVR